MAQHLLIGMAAALARVLGAPVTLLLGTLQSRLGRAVVRVLRTRARGLCADPSICGPHSDAGPAGWPVLHPAARLGHDPLMVAAAPAYAFLVVGLPVHLGHRRLRSRPAPGRRRAPDDHAGRGRARPRDHLPAHVRRGRAARRRVGQRGPRRGIADVVRRRPHRDRAGPGSAQSVAVASPDSLGVRDLPRGSTVAQ